MTDPKNLEDFELSDQNAFLEGICTSVWQQCVQQHIAAKNIVEIWYKLSYSKYNQELCLEYSEIIFGIYQNYEMNISKLCL